MNAGVPLDTKESTVVIAREGVHWLAFLVAFGMAFAAGVIGLFSGILLNDSISYSSPWWEPWWVWVPVVILSTGFGVFVTRIFNDKISISMDGLIIYRPRTAKNYRWADLGGIRRTLAFGDIVLTFAREGYFGVAISPKMAKTVLEHPSRPKDWYLPTPILEYIDTGKVPRGVSWIGGLPTIEQTRADQTQPQFYSQKMRARSKSWVGLAFSIAALLLILLTLLIVR